MKANAKTASASRPQSAINYKTVCFAFVFVHTSNEILYEHLAAGNSWVYLRRKLNAANTSELKAREGGKPPGSVIPGADPANSNEYEGLQQAWKKLEYTADMTMLLDPATEHKIQLGACAAPGQVSPTQSLVAEQSRQD